VKTRLLYFITCFALNFSFSQTNNGFQLNKSFATSFPINLCTNYIASIWCVWKFRPLFNSC